jgi:hypothetical protein
VSVRKGGVRTFVLIVQSSDFSKINVNVESSEEQECLIWELLGSVITNFI